LFIRLLPKGSEHMATIYINNVSSSSTSLSNGQQLDQSSTYTITIENNYSQTLNASVYFYNGTGMFDWDSSYDGETISTYSLWTAKGWLGPYTYKTVSAGTAEFGDSGPDSYGYLSAVKAIFTNVPSTVSAIGVDFYDGSSWSDRYYWSCKKPVSLTTPSAPTVSISGNTFQINWNSCIGSNGSGSVSYHLVYGDSENGYTAYTSSSTTSTSMSISRWITPTWNDVTYQFYVVATYSGVSRSSNSTGVTLNAPQLIWESNGLTITSTGSQVQASWNPASIANNYNGEVIQYSLVCQIREHGYDGTEYETTITETSHTFAPPAYDQELFIQITAWANNVGGNRYSEGVYFTVPSAPSHYTIRCYLNGGWQDCIIQYHDGVNWIECVAKYHDGSQWQDCSF